MNIDVTGLVASWAGNGYPSPEALGLLAGNETDGTLFKTFFSGDTYLAPHISVTYNSYPGQDAGRSVSPVGSGTNPIMTNSLTPTLTGGTSDPDGGTLRHDFEVYAGTSASPTTLVASGSGSATSGSVAAWTVPAGRLADGQTYEYRVRAFDGIDYGPWSAGWVQFGVDTQPPAAPTVSSSTFPQNQFVSSTTTSGTFSWTDGSSDVASYTWWMDNAATTTGTGTSANVSGLSQGAHTFHVQATDQAGNQTKTDYAFGIGNGALTSPADGARTQSAAALSANSPDSNGYGWVQYQYRLGATGSGSEHRGLLTSETTGMGGNPSTLTGIYDGDGRLVNETYPNGIVASSAFDNDGNKIALSYYGPGMGSNGLTYSADYDPHGKQTTANGPISAQSYSYDHDGRISTATDAADGTCTTRVYGYDLDSNRTSLAAQNSGNTGCLSPGSVTATPAAHGYDPGDRQTDTGYSYDSLGRTLTVPGIDLADSQATSLGYYVNDWAASETQGSHTISYGLDATQNRVRTQTDSATGHTTTQHYGDSSDSPAWTDNGDGTWTRNVTDLAGNLAASQSSTGTSELQLADLHGNIAVTVPDNTSAGAPDRVSDYTEFGATDNNTTAGTYGFEGTHRRATDNLSALILMGQRLYNPATGRFLQTDPVPGGSANNYDYCTADPINCTDLNGQWGHWRHWFGRATGYLAIPAYGAYYAGYYGNHWLGHRHIYGPQIYGWGLQASGILGDAAIDYVQARAKVNHDGVFDEHHRICTSGAHASGGGCGSNRYGPGLYYKNHQRGFRHMRLDFAW